jgi:hypothetical protein
VVKEADIHPHALDAAAAALDLQLRTEAVEQRSYIHRFPDGRLSVELEWIDANGLARAAILAYLGHIDAVTEEK